MGIGNRIARLRQSHRPKLTQEDFAKRIGISRAALSHYEKDRRDPDFETLIKIADFFDISLDFLLGREERTKAPEPQSLFTYDQIGVSQEDYDNLTPYQQEVLDWAINEDALFFKNKSDNVLDMLERLEIAYEVDKVMKKREKR